MGSDPGEAMTLDLWAASLRADAADIRLFLEVFATKLEAALPGLVEVRRQKGLLRRAHPVQALVMELGDRRFELRSHERSVQSRIALHSGGITLKTEDCSLEAWCWAARSITSGSSSPAGAGARS